MLSDKKLNKLFKAEDVAIIKTAKRHRMVNGKPVPYTDEENAERDIEENENNLKIAKLQSQQIEIDQLTLLGFTLEEAKLCKKLGLRPDIVSIYDAWEAKK